MPTFTENYAELRFGGPAWEGQETWSCGLKLKHLGGDEPIAMRDETISTIETVAGLVEDYFTGNSGFNGGCLLSWVRLNVINKANGKYYYPNTPNIFEWETPVSSGKNYGIPQVAYCVTMRGVRKRGPGARGRWYVPVTAAGPPVVTATGVMPATLAQGWADAAGTFLDALRNVDSGEGPAAWVPHLYGFSETSGADDGGLVSVSVGNVFDTQRRRRAQIEETYLPATTW